LIPPVLREPGFRLYWLGILLTNLGTRATVAANLWQVLQLTDSTLQVGLVGLAEAIALLGMAPLGGAFADRLDRRRLLQVTQGLSLLAALGLAVATLTQTIQPWLIYLAVIVVSASQTFDGPARQALIPTLVSRDRLVDAFALVNPTRELSILIGPALAGVLIAWVGAGAVYVFDAVTYAALVGVLAVLRIPRLESDRKQQSIWSSIAEGFAYVRERKLIWQLMSLDFAATFCIGYRVLLPTLARDILGVGAAGYGVLAAAPAAGAIVGSGIVYRLRNYPAKGALILAATLGYALAAMLLGVAPAFVIAVLAAALLGVFDAITTTLRHAVVQFDTPDHLRGRVTSAYQMVSRGGPSLGQVQMGALASAFGPLALVVGASATIAYTAWLALAGSTVRRYTSS